MTTLHAEESATIDASPDLVYQIISDYRNHHPHILPQAYFTKLDVEEGGQGAGTVFQAELSLYGQKRSFHMRVTEPEPGVLAETEPVSGLITTFRVEPGSHPDQSRVTIATTWKAQRGLQGWIERMTMPGMLRKIYREELIRLEQYARQVDRLPS